MNDADDHPVRKARARAFTVIDGGTPPAAPSAAPPPRRRRSAKSSSNPAPPASPIPEGGGPAKFTPEDAERVRECRSLDLNDRDNGRRLWIWRGDQLLYVASGPGWHYWTGTHWQADVGLLNVLAEAQRLVDWIKHEADAIEPSTAQAELIERAKPLRGKAASALSAEDVKTIKAADNTAEMLEAAKHKRRQFAIASGNAGRTEAAVRQAAPQRHVPPEALDADPMRFNVRNGTLVFSRIPDPERPDGSDRLAGQVELLPHDRADLITRLAAVDYDPDAEAPKFQAFLDRVMPDAAMQRFLQVAHGWAGLIGGNDEQALIFHYGRGANGKSAFMEAVGQTCGGYRVVVAPESFTGQGQRQGNQQNSDMARLNNARLVTVTELPRGEPLKEALIKALTGGEPIVARFLNKEFFEFTPIFVPVMSGNDLPTISGTDLGIWRRLKIVPWRETIPDEERMSFGSLLEQFAGERSGILNWLIDGALAWLGQGLSAHTPAEVRNFTDKHREDRDVLGNFLAAFVKREPGAKTQAKVLLDAFNVYCEMNGIKSWYQTTFAAGLKARGFERQQGRHVFYLDTLLVDPPRRDPFGPPPRFGEEE